MDSRWPLILVLGVIWCAGILLVLGLLWLVQHSPLPGPVKFVLDCLLVGFLVPGATAATRRRRAGPHPRAKSRPERG